MGEKFKISLTFLDKGKERSYSFYVDRGRNLMGAILKVLREELKVEVAVVKDILGPELARAGNLEKTEKLGLHFTIDGKVPVYQFKSGEKLYLSFFHIQVNRDMDIRLELVSASCDFANSVVKPQLKFRTPDFDLEELPGAPQEIQMKFRKPIVLELDRYFWMLNMRRSALLFGGFPDRKLIRDTGVSYPQPSVQFNPNANPAKEKQASQQPFSPFQLMPSSFDEPAAELMPLHIPVSSSPKPDRKPPGCFLQETRAQSDAIVAWEKGESTGEMPASLPSASQMPTMMPQNEPIFVEGEKTPVIGGQHEPIAALEAGNSDVISLQMPQAAVQGVQQGYQETKNTAMQKENAPKAGSDRKKILRQQSEIKQSSSHGAKAAGFVPLSSITSFKAVIFDLDGVIINSMELHRRSFNDLLAPLGISISAKAFKKYGGTRSETIIAELFVQHGVKESVKEWTKKRTALYQEYLEKSGVKPIEGFNEFYEMLLSNGIKVAVASSGEEPHICSALESIGVRGVPVVSIQQVKRGKPAPDLFLLAAKRLKVKKGQVIVFEDAPAGLEAAQRAGMMAIALSTTLSAKSLKGRAALIVRNFNSPQLRKLFSRLLGGR